MKSLVFRIRKRYFDAVVSGEKTIEYRRDTPFWQKRAWNGGPGGCRNLRGKGWIAVFICGKRVHRRQLTRIERIQTPGWFSEQGQKDVDTPSCLAFFLGKEVLVNGKENQKKMRYHYMEYVFATSGLFTKILFVILYWDEILYHLLVEENQTK